VITMELLGKVRGMQVRDKLSERAIAKRTGHSRNTVHKWLQTPEEVKTPRYVRAKGYSKLGAFIDELELALKADALRQKKDRRTERALLAQLKASGYTRVTDYIRAWRANAGKDLLRLLRSCRSTNPQHTGYPSWLCSQVHTEALDARKQVLAKHACLCAPPQELPCPHSPHK
jgi:hypothetical protein